MTLNFPDSPGNGEKYLAENGIEYTYNIANDTWTGALSAQNVPIDPLPSDISVDPAFGNPSGTNPGSGTLEDPFIITNSIVPTLGGTAVSLQTITITNGKAGDQVVFTNNTTPSTISSKYTQPLGFVDANGKWTGNLIYNDSFGADTTENITYTGNLQCGATTVYFRWLVQQQATPAMFVTAGTALTGTPVSGTDLGATQPTVSGGLSPYTYSYKWQTSDDNIAFTDIPSAITSTYSLTSSNVGKYIRCVATVSDSSVIQAVTVSSITAVVNVVSIDITLSTSNPQANQPIQAVAVVAGGVAPVSKAYQWKANDVNILDATSAIYVVEVATNGKRLSCQVTTTDGDNTNAVKTSTQTNPVASGDVPEINTVTLAEVTPDTPDRFTDQSFTVAVDMTKDQPKSDYAIRGKVLGDLTVDVSTSVITKLEEQAVDGSWNGVAAPEANNWGSVTYGNGKFVAVSTDGTNRVMYSADGTNWTSATQEGDALWYGVTYGDGKFVAVGGGFVTDQQVMYSTDGINWTSTDANAPNNWYTITYGDGKFVAVSQDGDNRVMYSTNGGIDWILTSAPAASWQSVTYADGKYVAVGGSAVMYSYDGISWLTAQAAEANNWQSVTYGNGKFVAVASTGTNQVMYSTDGINWIATPATEANFWTSVTYGDGKFVALSDSGANQLMYSTDGISWTAATTEVGGWKSIIYGGDKFVAVGNTGINLVMWSYTGTGAAGTEQVLTLTDTTGLSSINQGDTVIQNSGGTPVTSAITNVSDEPGWTVVIGGGVSANLYGTAGADKYNVLDSDITDFISIASPDYGTYSWTRDFASNPVPINSSLQVYVQSLDAFNPNEIRLTVNETVVSYINIANRVDTLVDVPFTGQSQLTSIKLDAVAGTGWNCYLYYIVVDGKVLTVDPNFGTVNPEYISKLLTLTNDTNLANFRVGDVVGVDLATQAVTLAPGNPDYFYAPDPGLSYYNILKTGTYTDTFYVKEAGTLILNVYGNIASPGSVTFDVTVDNGTCSLGSQFTIPASETLNPEFVFAGVGSCSITYTNTTLDGNGRYYLDYGAGSTSYWTPSGGSQVPLSATNLGIGTNVSVTAINEATPSITTNGGIWSGTDGTGEPGWNQSKEWSGTLTGRGGVGNAQQAFNGDITNHANGVTYPNGSLTWTASSYGISGNLKVTVQGNQQGANTIVVPGKANQSTIIGDSSNQVFDFGTVTNLASVIINGYALQPNLAAIQIDDLFLVNTSISGGPETFVTGPTVPASSGTVKLAGAREEKKAIRTSTITNVYDDTGSWTGALIDGGGTAAVNKQQRKAAFGNGKVVFVSTFGGIISSTDGISFTIERNPNSTPSNTTDCFDIAYGNGRFVAVGTNSAVPAQPIAFIQIDGETTWNQYPIGRSLDGFQQCIAFGNGKFVAPTVGENGRKWAVSTDGINWTFDDDGTSTKPINAITFGGGYFCAGGTYDFLGFSTDGINWTSATSGTNYSSEQYQDATYGDGMWAITGTNNTNGNSVTYYTSNRTSWTKSSANNLGGKSIGYGDGTWVIVDSDGATIQSTDDISSFSLTPGQPPQGDYQGIIYSFGRWILGTRANATNQASMWQSVFAGNPGTILTLTDTTDLARFTPGDVVQGNNTPDYSKPTNLENASYGVNVGKGWPEILNQTMGSTWDTNGSQYWCYSSGGSSITFQYTSSNPISLYVTSSGGAGNTITITGDVSETSAVISNNTNSGGICEPTVLTPTKTSGTFTITQGASTYYWFNVGGNLVKVVSTNVSTPSITTDGGSWSGTDDTSSGFVDERQTKVTGPVKTTEVAGPYLTLSSSSGRWLVTETGYSAPLKLNKFVKASSLQSVASLFTVMDALGNITDLSLEDPGYTEMVGDPTYTLTFPSIFSAGETPDVELPPGTKYQVEVKATNDVGVDNAFSNDVMPVAGLLQTSVITDIEEISLLNITNNIMNNNGSAIAADPNADKLVIACPMFNGSEINRSQELGGANYTVTFGSDQSFTTCPAAGPYGVGTYAYNAGATTTQNSGVTLITQALLESDWNDGTESFTLEGWFYGDPAGDNNTSDAMFSRYFGSGASVMLNILGSGDSGQFLWSYMEGDGLAKSYSFLDKDAPVEGRWNHYAFSFDGPNSIMYQSQNGVVVAAALTTPANWKGLGEPISSQPDMDLLLGGYSGGTNAGKYTPGGWWSDVRVYKGLCKYTAGFAAGRTTLTTADNTNYNLFSAGDAVVESSGGTPVTSAITNVTIANTTINTNGISTNTGLVTQAEANNAFDGNTATSFGYKDQGGLTLYKTWVLDNPILVKAGATLKVTGGKGDNDWKPSIKFTDGTTFNRLDAAVAMTEDKYISAINAGSFGLGDQYSWITTIEVNGSPLIANAAAPFPYGTLLTLTNDTNLANFRVGDKLNGGSGMTPVIYTGTGALQSISCGFSPDLVWIKSRNNSYDHNLADTVRGNESYLSSDSTNAEGFTYSGVMSFDSDGFTLGTNGEYNETTSKFVAWCWDAGNTTVTNNDGSIASQVRSNGNFSVVKYSPTASGSQSFGHGLDNPVDFVITKPLDRTANWNVGSSSLPDWTYAPNLNLTDSATPGGKEWDEQAPDSSVVYINASNTLYTGENYIAYCWAETPGISSFGSYTGNSLADGPVIDCGFEPAFVMVKCTTNGGTSWNIVDSARGVDYQLYADLTNAENNLPGYVEFTSTGFKVTTTSGDWNGTGETFIYAAFARSSIITNINEAANQMTVDSGSFSPLVNSSRQWSDGVSSNNGGFGSSEQPEMGFDGLPDTKCKCQQNNAIITIAFSPAITVNKSLKLRYAGSGFGSGYIQIEANGTEVVDTPASGKDGTIIDIPFTGSLTSISIQEGSQNAGFSQIFVDGDVLMNGPWNTSKNWAASSGLNTSNRGPITLAFNGSIGDSVSEGINNSDTVVIGTNITINTSLQYWSYNSSGVSTTWRFKRASDGNIAVTTLDSADKNDYDYTTVPLPTESGHGLGVEYSQISAQRSTSYETISAIRLDGQVLVDPTTISVTEVTGPTFPPATGTISTVDSTNSKITFSETTGRWLVTHSDYDTDKKLDTKVNAPLVLDASNSAHVALFNSMNTKFTAFPAARQTFIDALRTKIIGLTLTTPELEVLCGSSKSLIIS